MPNDVARPERQHGTVVTLKSKMAASHGASSGGNSKCMAYKARSKVKQVARAATRRPSHIRTRVSITVIKLPALEKYDAIFDSFVTTTPTMDVQAGKALLDVIIYP